MKDKKIESQNIYEYFSSQPTLLAPVDMDIAGLIDCVHKRFNVDKINEEEHVSIVRLYKSMVEGLERCFAGRGEGDRNDIAFRLFKLLEENYFGYKLTLNMKIFYAAVIHICFKNICENEALILKLFRPLDSTADETNAFCRFVVISEIELYSTCHFMEVLKAYYKVINADSHIFKYMYDEDELCKILICMWETDKSKMQDKMEKLRVFLAWDEAKPIRGAYWTLRKDFN